ncbi:MAG: type III-A CRISPR-associated protein Cas10/Csm1 [Ruminococcus sp.]|nr:type III-A CRISPR-associated protein Cas10/Csm1 [Ruminococcus sp.]
MDNRKVKLLTGSLLHDVGKLLYRYSDGRNHSTSGYEFVKSIPAFSEERELLNCIRYHHGDMLKKADIDSGELCYITYIADNIAAFSDRRDNGSGEGGFVRDISLESIFNILNGADDSMSYPPSVLSDEDDSIVYPESGNITYSEGYYGKIAENIKDCLTGFECSFDYVNSLSEIMEAYTSYVPSSTRTRERRDISLYDHSKLTAAIAGCIYDYLSEAGVSDLRKELLNGSKEFYGKNAFILLGADISGIQNFIYSISFSGALKGLRSRSFYLEILMEHAVDELLEGLELTRNNVLYTGGGRTYALLPNTKKARDFIAGFETRLNKWFLDNFGADLFIGIGFRECSANSLRFSDGTGESGEKGYSELFGEVSAMISEKKLCRYTADRIIQLNSGGTDDNERECAVCGRQDRLVRGEREDEYICRICSSLKKLSDDIFDGEFFTVRLSEEPNEQKGVILPFGKSLVSDGRESLVKRMKEDYGFVRCYCKNKMYAGFRLVKRLWTADYAAEKDFVRLAEKSRGIKRLAVLRADVDNLGSAFSGGFEDKYKTLSRTSELSKKLSLFFKHHITSIMKKGEFSICGKTGSPRNAVIIYSGGDDIFAVGGWDDIIGFAADLHNALKRFSQGTVTISAGIGLYTPSYPLYAMAEETGRLEEISKSNEGKNSVTLFDKSGCYHWDEFIERVAGEKLSALDKYLNVRDEKGMAMLYNMLDLIRRREEEDRLNLARFAYFTARLAPDGKMCADDKEFARKQEEYREFSGRMYSWIQNERDCRELVTAIYLYVYKARTASPDDTDAASAENNLRGIPV